MKFTDFGLAKHFSLPNISALTNHIWGAVVTSPEYFFKIWENPTISEYKLGDFYALGIILHFLFHRYPMIYLVRFQSEMHNYILQNHPDLETLTIDKKMKYMRIG